MRIRRSRHAAPLGGGVGRLGGSTSGTPPASGAGTGCTQVTAGRLGQVRRGVRGRHPVAERPWRGRRLPRV